MPSVFNHENSCWGVKRSFCNVFQYDLHEEVQHSKLPELGDAPSSICPTPVCLNNSFQYSVSSNGYYGYQPHSIVADQINDNSGITVCECGDDNAMEVEDNSNKYQSVSVENPFTINCNVLNTSRFQNVKRKRHMPECNEDATKRMRQNECGGGDGSSLKSRRTLTSRNKVDSRQIDISHHTTTSLLLKETHGCEMYIFERTCDY